MQLAVEMYGFTAQLPALERLNLTLQLQQAAVSIPTRMAAGSRSGSKNGLISALEDSLISLAQIETLLIIAGNLYETLDVQPMLERLETVEAEIRPLMQRLKNPPKKI